MVVGDGGRMCVRRLGCFATLCACIGVRISVMGDSRDTLQESLASP